MRKTKFIFFIITLIFLSNFTFISASSDGIDVNLHIGTCNNNNICEEGSEDFFVCPADCTPIIIPPTVVSGKSTSGSLVMDNVFNDFRIEVSYHTATIKWKSPIPIMSNLKWGTSPDYKDGVIRNINFLLNHKIELTNLKDGTLYYFNIQAENLLGKTNQLENQIFRTLSLPDITPPNNPTDVIASSDASGITVSWNNSTDEDFDYIRVMKNTDRYYGSPNVGYLVYEGNGNYFTDSKVKEKNKYFYSLFSRDRAGNYSSGSIIDVIHNPKGLDTWGLELNPVEKINELPNSFIVEEGSSTYDFKMGSTLYLVGDQSINIKTNYSSQIKNDDLWVEIRDSEKKILYQYLFSRITDSDGFINVSIPALQEGGDYYISIHRYNNGEPQIINQGVFQISKVVVDQVNSYSWYIVWFIIFIIFILFILYLLYFVILPRIFNHDK